jgi:hypothetical protein
MASFMLSLPTFILHLFIFFPFSTLTLAQDVVLNGTKIIDNEATATPSAHLNARKEGAFTFKWCSKISWQGVCYFGAIYPSEVSTGGCLRVPSYGSWQSIGIDSFVHTVDIYRDAYCQRIGLKGVKQPGVENIPGQGITEFTTEYFSIKVWLL